jgi:hypothetical protein
MTATAFIVVQDLPENETPGLRVLLFKEKAEGAPLAQGEKKTPTDKNKNKKKEKNDEQNKSAAR